MAKDLILEIGCEEIPAGFISLALDRLEAALKKGFASERLECERIEKLGTPRRLALIVHGLIELTPKTTTKTMGPNKKAAFDENGNPTRALEGFARGQGVDPKKIKVMETDKGEYVYAEKRAGGEKTTKILPGLLVSALSADLFSKSMRWGGHEASFARPVHWILALYGKERVRFSWAHIESGSATYGHRFMSAAKGGEGAKAIKVKDAESYVEGLKKAYVIVDTAERKRLITTGIEEAAASVAGTVLEDTALVEEVASLVEYPVVLMGSFEEEYLELPRDVVVNAMREHQRYFSVVDKKGALASNFITVANTEAVDMDVVRKGNERVLRARLGDARFYFDQDVRKGLVEMAEELKGVVFQKKLGTSYEKVERFTELALYIGEKTGFSMPAKPDEKVAEYLTGKFNPTAFDISSADPAFYKKLVLGRAAVLSKADLVSGVVGEFPKLQGIMGGVYAESGGEAPEVCAAISEHYMPTASGGKLPDSDAGAIISVADKLDTICGCFGVGLIPTGAQDPYALRRSALGIIAIILGKGLKVSIADALDKALDLVGKKLTRERAEVRHDVLEFFKERLRNMLLAQGLSFDAIDAVLAARWYYFIDAVKRIRALETFKDHPDCARLVVAFKRVSNILKEIEPGSVKPERSLLKDEHELALFAVYEELLPRINEFHSKDDYSGAFASLASIKDTIDAFFDSVMVMVDDMEVRNNRLALLSAVRDLYFNTADISKLSV